MNNKMNICLISNNAYAKYLETLIVSILLNSNEEDNFHFHIIEDNISNDYKNDILKLKEVKEFSITYYQSPNIEKYKKLAKYFKSIIGDKYIWSYQIYLKLDILFLFNDLDKILFLDIDQIAVSGISELFKLDLKNNYCLIFQHPLDDCKRILNNTDLSNFIINKIGIENPEEGYFTAEIILFNLETIRSNFSIDYLNKCIIECFDINTSPIYTEEFVFLYIFQKNILRIDGKLNEIKSIPNNYDDFNTRKLKLIHYGGYRLKKYLSYNYNEEIDNAYIYYWEYFCKTPFYKNNYVEYSNIHMVHLRRWLLQEREERKWHIEDSRNYSKNNYNRLLNMILWIIPIKSIRDKLRNIYIINELS